MKNEIIIKIQELRSEGKSYGDIARELLITKSQACYFSKIDLNERKEKLNDKLSFEEKICELARKCENINQICKIIGKKPTNENYKKIRNILQINNIDISHFNKEICSNNTSPKKDIECYLVSGSTIAISKLRERIIKNGIKERKCEKCGRTEWEGEQIPLELHHINGDRLVSEEIFVQNLKELKFCKNNEDDILEFIVNAFRNSNKIISFNLVKRKISSNLKNFSDEAMAENNIAEDNNQEITSQMVNNEGAENNEENNE